MKGRVVEFMRSESENPVSRIRVLPAETTLFEGTVLNPEETRKAAMSEIVRQAQAADLVPARAIEEKLHSRYVGAIPLCHRLNYKNFVELLADVPGVNIFWKENAPYVNARRPPQLGGGRLGMTRGDNQARGLSGEDSVRVPKVPKRPARIEDLIRARVEAMLKPGERIALTTVGDKIVDVAGPGGRNLKAAGYRNLSDALRRLSGFSLLHDAGMAYLSRSPESATKPRVEPDAGQVGSPEATRSKLSEARIEDRVRQRLEELLPSPNDRLAVAAVGNKLSDLIGPAGKNLKAAGYRTLSDLLRHLKGFVVTGTGPGIQVGRSGSPKESQSLRRPMHNSASEHRVAPVPNRELRDNRAQPPALIQQPKNARTAPTAAAAVSVKEQVRKRLLDMLPTSEASLPLTTLGARLTDILGVGGTDLRAAGYSKLTDLLIEIDGFGVSGEGANLRISRTP